MSSNDDPAIGVVIIDDDRTYAEGLAELLTLSDRFAVMGVATNVNAGLELLSEQQVRLGLVDVRMPDGGGVEIVKEVKTWADPPALVLISAQEPTAAARASGADFMSKHQIDEDELLALIRGC